MATYAIGDVHGCFLTLERLLSEVPFEAGCDHLWMTGDLVNRGPRSLEVLRWAEQASRSMGERFVSVLGNHDLHLLAMAAGFGKPHHRASLAPVVTAPDAEALVEWLARRPLLHARNSKALVHAGLMPEWSLSDASAKARGLEAVLVDPAQRTELFESLAEDGAVWPRDLYGFTSLRMLDPEDQPCNFTGPPDEAPGGCRPWFSNDRRQSRSVTIVAGHWAALGLRLEESFLGLDTGCVYGGSLTAVRLEDRAVFSVPNCEGRA